MANPVGAIATPNCCTFAGKVNLGAESPTAPSRVDVAKWNGLSETAQISYDITSYNFMILKLTLLLFSSLQEK